MKTLVNVIALSILGLSPLAAGSHGGARVHEINTRRQNEQERIADGFANGELTSAQDKALEKREAHISKLEHRDLKQDDGTLTKSDAEQLKRDENHISRTIRRDKHG